MVKDNRNFIFGAEIIALIQQHYPAALKGDAEEIAAASGALATSLGGLLAFAFKFGGPEGASAIIELMIDKIIENASAIDKKADEIIKSGIRKRIGH